jgi:hypothetical protein
VRGPEEGPPAVDGERREDAAPVERRARHGAQAGLRRFEQTFVEEDVRVHLRRSDVKPFGGQRLGKRAEDT